MSVVMRSSRLYSTQVQHARATVIRPLQLGLQPGLTQWEPAKCDISAAICGGDKKLKYDKFEVDFWIKIWGLTGTGGGVQDVGDVKAAEAAT